MEKKLNLKQLLANNWLYIVLGCLIVTFSIISPTFLGKANIGNFLDKYLLLV